MELRDDEFVQEEAKRFVRLMMKSRCIDEFRSPGEWVGAENMLYWLMEEPEEMKRFEKVRKHATKGC